MSSSRLSSVLILPVPPLPPTTAAIKVAYHPPLSAAVTTLASLKRSRPAILEVFLPCPGEYAIERPRSDLFKNVEGLLASLYSLIALVCADNAIDQDGDGGVDARIILVAKDGSDLSSDNTMVPSISGAAAGPIIDIQTIALTRRHWHYIFSVDGEQGQEALNHYLDFASRTSPLIEGNIHKVPGGICLLSSVDSVLHKSEGLPAIHTTVAVGGTFDHLHAGHKLLLTATALLLQPPASPTLAHRRMIVGITGDSLLKNKKYSEYLQSWKKRQEAVVDFLLTILLFARSSNEELETVTLDETVVNGRAIHTRLKQAQITIECVEIQDPFGPTITDETVSALVVSGETRSGGAAVNTKRTEKGWPALEVFEVDILDAEEEKSSVNGGEDFAAKISSTAIRKRKAEGARRHLL